MLNEAAVAVNENDLQAFSTEELIYIALLDADGIRFYMDSKPVLGRENLFKAVYGRDTEYYQQQGFIEKSWKKVSGYEANGYFKGKVLSEADLVFSFDELRVFDIYSVIDLVKFVGLTVISTLLLAEVGYVVSANIEALALYIQSYGVINGVNFYLTLGAANAPTVQNSLMKSLETDATSGYDDIYTLIEFADDTLNIEEDVWALGPIKRGDLIDEVCGNNLGHNFPVIDKIEDRVITSVKSIDIRLTSYSDKKGIYNKIVREARKLNGFRYKTWGKNNVQIADYDSKVLQIVVPNTTITADQMAGLQAAQLYIKNTYNIQLVLTVTK